MGMLLLNVAMAVGDYHDCGIIAYMEPASETCSVRCVAPDLVSEDLVGKCPYLQKYYGYGDGISTAIDGVSLSSLPIPTAEFQRLISDAEDGDTIILPGGHYTENNISIDKNLTVYGDGYVVVDGRGKGIILNIEEDNPNANVTFESINFINGYSSEKDYSSKGGAIINNGSLTMTRCLIFNSTANSGAGISNRGTLTLENCEFRDNGASDRGGAIHNDNGTLSMKECILSSNCGYGSALYAVNGHVVLKDCEFKENEGGAGILIDGGSLQLDNCSIHDNHGRCFGGGIMAVGDLTINGGAIFNNTAVYGGGIHVYGGSHTFNQVAIHDNKATLGGGGICSHLSTIILNRVSLEGNSAKQGGAIYNYYSEMGARENTNISNNTASLGGGVYNNESSNLELSDQTVLIGNNADKGAGIYNVKGSRLKIKGKSNLIQNMAEDKGGAIYNEGLMSLKGGSIAENIPDNIYNP
jgi:hypothetical protein